MRDDRYQHQSWSIKLWRHRWRLWYYLIATWCSIKWLCQGCPYRECGMIDDYIIYDSRWKTFKLIWILANGEASIRMNWLYDHEEVVKDELQ